MVHAAVSGLGLALKGIGQESVRALDVGRICDRVEVVLGGNTAENSGGSAGTFLNLEDSLAHADLVRLAPAIHAQRPVGGEVDGELRLGFIFGCRIVFLAGDGKHRYGKHDYQEKIAFHVLCYFSTITI